MDKPTLIKLWKTSRETALIGEKLSQLENRPSYELNDPLIRNEYNQVRTGLVAEAKKQAELEFKILFSAPPSTKCSLIN